MQQITVIGSGTMGNGIAHVFAQHEYHVNLVDLSKEALDKAVQTITQNLDRQIKKSLITESEKEKTLSAITTYTDLQQAVKNADLVIEAATENEKIKLDLFKQLSEFTHEKTLLASNTSSISITKIASVTHRPEKVIGMHFMNPVPIMSLVEVVNGYSTSKETTAAVMDLARKLHKVPCKANDYPGFVANRILMPMINEAVYTLYEGVADVEAIDTIMKLGMAHPMGPLQLADFIGLDVCLSILRVLHQNLGLSKYAPCPLLINMVTAGKLGVKTGEGFYEYKSGSKEKKVSDRFKM